MCLGQTRAAAPEPQETARPRWVYLGQMRLRWVYLRQKAPPEVGCTSDKRARLRWGWASDKRARQKKISVISVGVGGLVRSGPTPGYLPAALIRPRGANAAHGFQSPRARSSGWPGYPPLAAKTGSPQLPAPCPRNRYCRLFVLSVKHPATMRTFTHHRPTVLR